MPSTAPCGKGGTVRSVAGRSGPGPFATTEPRRGVDVRRFFESIDHDILWKQLVRDIPCADTREICRRIISHGGSHGGPRWHFPGDDLFSPLSHSVGLPIGSLTSQHFANRFLSPVDHRAKDRLRIRAYLRYMVDMLIFGDSREQLADWGHAIEQACHRQRLRLHPWQVQATRSGLRWLGFVILPNVVRVSRSSVRRALRRLRRLRGPAASRPSSEFASSLRSTFAHWNHADSFRLRTMVLRELGLLPDEE